jgi:di/tricarboxylate transporter
MAATINPNTVDVVRSFLTFLICSFNKKMIVRTMTVILEMVLTNLYSPHRHTWLAEYGKKRRRLYRRRLDGVRCLLVLVLALLVGDAAAGLAGGLAGGLALAAAAVLGALAQRTGLQGLDSFHDTYLHSVRICLFGPPTAI